MSILKVKITPAPAVLSALEAAFPKPEGGARRILEKYIAVLEDLVEESLLTGRSVLAQRHEDWFDLSTKTLGEKSGQINRTDSKKIRTHKWLKDNHVPLIQAVELGSNFKGYKSIVCFTKNASLSISHNLRHLRTMSPPELASFLSILTQEDQSEVQAHLQSISPSECDVSPINVSAVSKYIEKIVNKKIQPNWASEERSVNQALWLLRVGQTMNGRLLQPRKVSLFGRTYYGGVSVQNVHSTLRDAMLSDSWEYDVKSSVICWKLKSILEIRGVDKSDAAFNSSFPSTLSYLKNKPVFYSGIKNQTFDASSRSNNLHQTELIKKAFTAMSFGARLSQASWKNKHGDEVHSSLFDIFSDATERDRFFKCPEVVAFSVEQKKIDEEITKHLRRTANPALILPHLKTERGYQSRSKVLAHLYQHAETEMMEKVRDELAKFGKTLLANIHDAVVIRERLSTNEKRVIEKAVQATFANPFFTLGETQLKSP